MKDVVITVGSANGSALALIRAIKKKIACKAYVLCTNQRTAGLIASSKYVNEVYLIADKGEQEYITEIMKWHATKSFDEKPILYFTFDTACYYVDNNRQWFEDNFTLCLPSTEIIQTYTQKGLAETAAERAGLAVPKTDIIDTTDDIEQVINTFSFPVIIKPRATYLRGNINFKIKVFDNKEGFRTEAKRIISNNNSLLCQEFIPGGNDTAWYYLFHRDSEGHIYDSMGKKTLQSSANGGIMLKGCSEYNDSISQICHLFLNTIDYKGIGGIEFKYHNGKYYFIEMSTRLEGFYQITENAGMPLSLIYYYDLNGEKEELKIFRNKKQNDGLVYIDLYGTIINRIKSKKLISLTGELFNATFNAKTTPNIYDKTEKKPFFKQFFKNI